MRFDAIDSQEVENISDEKMCILIFFTDLNYEDAVQVIYSS